MVPMQIALLTAVVAAFVAVLFFLVRHRREDPFLPGGAGLKGLAGQVADLSSSRRLATPRWMPSAAPSKFARFLRLR
jgi:hypothetical protein